MVFMFKKLLLLGIIFSFTVVIGGGDSEDFLFFKSSGLASIGPCRTMDPMENQIRRKAANVILEIYDVVNNKGRFPELKQNAGKALQEEFSIPSSWEVTQASSRIEGIQIRHVSPKEDVSLSKCVSHICEYKGELVVECTSAATMAKFSVFSAFYSDLRINSIKSFLCRELPNFAIATYFEKLNTIFSNYLYDELLSTDDISDIQLGDFLYIKGHPLCLTADYARGENLYCVGFKRCNPMFIGFGQLFIDGPKTAEQIQHSLAEAYALQSPDYVEAAEALREVKKQHFYQSKIGIEKIRKALRL